MRRAPLVGLTVVVAAVVTVAVEIAVFVAAVRLVGLPWALGALLALSVLGGWLAPRQGVRAWRRFRAAAEAGRPPGRQVTDGLIGLIGALLLALPGFVSALVGAALLVPPLRWYARDRLERSVERRVSSSAAGSLFGPRRVRVRRGRAGAATEPSPSPPTQSTQPTPPTPPTQPTQSTGPPPAIEGEIIDRP